MSLREKKKTELTSTVVKLAHLYTDHNDQRGCYGDGESLLIRDLCAVIPHSDHEGPIWDEEEDKRGADPLQCTGEELSLVEELVKLPRSVQVWIA